MIWVYSMKKALVKQFTAAELVETKSRKNQAVQSTSDRDFPCGLVAKTACAQCGGLGSVRG